MPWARNRDLPRSVLGSIPSDEGRGLFRRVANSMYRQGADDAAAMAAAWAALREAGYVRTDDGWVRKALPSAADVHVPAPGRRKETDKAAPDLTPPKAAQENARRAIRWREEHGDAVRGGTRVGWTRARQLAEGGPMSPETVRRMAAFSRHRKNSKIAPEHRNEPWRDAGHVAWLLWGGDEGVDWAVKTSDQIRKRQMGDDIFTLRREAETRAAELGLEGAHLHELEGEAVFMPGASHEDYLRAKQGEEQGQSVARLIVHHLSGMLRGGPFGGGVPVDVGVEGAILKADLDERMVWGWASVITTPEGVVFDSQGDAIDPDTMTKAATKFMLEARVAKTMHEGPQVGEVVHSLPLTYDIAKALGVETPIEGWIIAMKIHDDETWSRIKSGKLGAFSIGGKALREVISDE